MQAKKNKCLLKSLESTTFRIFKWFSGNQQKIKGDKCHFLLSTTNKVVKNVDSAQIENRHSEKLFDVTIEIILSFKECKNSLWNSKVKLSALGRRLLWNLIVSGVLYYQKQIRSTFYSRCVNSVHNEFMN